MINPKKKKDDGKWEYIHGSHLCWYIGAIGPIHTDISSKNKNKKNKLPPTLKLIDAQPLF